jgi:hypothetical protein
MGMTAANITEAARNNLREAAAVNWSAAEIVLWLAQVVREIARKAGLQKRANLSVVQYTNNVDLGTLPYINIATIEYPVGSLTYKSCKQYGSTLDLGVTEPTVTSGTLTGTVTFAPGSRSVSGSSTLFTTELQEGYLIQVGKVADAAYKWYQIAKITSATALTLVEPFEESTTADTVSLTKYRDASSCARVYYTGEYTVSTTSDMPARFDEVAILGTVAHSATEYASNYAQVKMTAVTTALSSSITTIGYVKAGLDRSIVDIGIDRTNLAASLILYNSYLADIESALDLSNTSLDSGITVVNTVNTGGDVTRKYIDTAKASAEEARARIEQAKMFLSAGNDSKYISLAKGEIETAAGWVNQVDGYMKQAQASVNTAQIISSYKGWAEKKWDEYQKALNKIGREESIYR